MKIVETFAEVRAAAAGVVGLSPTMGALHEGHLSHVRRARADNDTVVVSLFVNPLQFGDGTDLTKYPRDLDRDAALVADHGADILFAPPLEEMYPELPSTRVTVEALTLGMEGVYRPGHFEGVAIAVAKLLAGIQPQRAYFGRKDAQQLAVVRRLVRDLSFPVEIVPGSTVRDADGLALSSRNVRLSPEERATGLALSRGLEAAARAVEAGERRAAEIEQAAYAVLADADGLDIDYVALADAAETVHLIRLDREAFLAVAGVVGSIRLIDNYWFTPAGDAFAVDRGNRLAGPREGDD